MGWGGSDAQCNAADLLIPLPKPRPARTLMYKN